MRFEPNLSLFFAELPLLERPRAAATAGFDAAELWWPFPDPDPGGAAVDALVEAFEDAGIGLACLNFDGGDLAGGQRGLTSLPDARARFRANVPVVMAIAERLGCGVLNALYGNRVDGLLDAAQEAVAIENLAFAAEAADAIGARIVLEAINPVDIPSYGLPHIQDALALADRVLAATGTVLWLDLDVYHVGKAGDDAVDFLRRHPDRIAHVQIADVPDRHEPGSGTFPFEAFMEALHAVDYGGWIGLEYVPRGDSAASLGAAAVYLGAAAPEHLEGGAS